ncbi:MAG: DUF3570 domain-containing protein [Deltaproteobacteria bacterium]|nr:DUF3570 domain-containing protein [Deltaproteobacteria bacterium]
MSRWSHRSRVVASLALLGAGVSSITLGVSSLVTGQSIEETPPPNGVLSIDAFAQPDGNPLPDPDLRIDRFGARLSVFHQTGRGYQSQAEIDASGRGSEFVFIANPVIYTHITHREGITHDVYLPIDILTSASTDALDAVSTASRDNESFTLDVTTTIPDGNDTRYFLRWGAHVEEELKAGNGGLGISLDLADDNAQLILGVDAIVDIFDPVQYNGTDLGLTERLTLSANGTLSQLLSETTTLAVSVGLTGQIGHIQTPWNSVPLTDGTVRDGGRTADLFPPSRLRAAASARLAQAVPDSRTYLQAAYRLYLDDYGVVAHSAEGTVTQYLTDDFWLRGSYRFHSQGAPYFWANELPRSSALRMYRTADSDLAALDLHEVSASFRYFYDRQGQPSDRSGYVELGYTYYGRSNSLEIHMGTLGFQTAFW